MHAVISGPTSARSPPRTGLEIRFSKFGKNMTIPSMQLHDSLRLVLEAMESELIQESTKASGDSALLHLSEQTTTTVAQAMLGATASTAAGCARRQLGLDALAMPQQQSVARQRAPHGGSPTSVKTCGLEWALDRAAPAAPGCTGPSYLYDRLSCILLGSDMRALLNSLNRLSRGCVGDSRSIFIHNILREYYRR